MRIEDSLIQRQKKIENRIKGSMHLNLTSNPLDDDDEKKR